jgi:hypothetical protein
MTTTTIRAGRKIATRRRVTPFPPQKAKKPYTRADLAAEVYALTGREYNAGFLCDCLAGTRKTPRDLVDHRILERAVENLTRRAQAA